MWKPRAAATSGRIHLGIRTRIGGPEAVWDPRRHSGGSPSLLSRRHRVLVLHWSQRGQDLPAIGPRLIDPAGFGKGVAQIEMAE